MVQIFNQALLVTIQFFQQLLLLEEEEQDIMGVQQLVDQEGVVLLAQVALVVLVILLPLVHLKEILVAQLQQLETM